MKKRPIRPNSKGSIWRLPKYNYAFNPEGLSKKDLEQGPVKWVYNKWAGKAIIGQRAPRSKLSQAEYKTGSVALLCFYHFKNQQLLANHDRAVL